MSEYIADSENLDDVERYRRRFLTGVVTVLGAVGAGFGSVPFIASFQPSAKARAVGAPVEADISRVEPGQRIIVQWRGMPVWVVRRTPEMLAVLDDTSKLDDPESNKSIQPDYAKNEYRAIKPEYLILIGICTHLGCSPTFVVAEDGPNAGLGAEWEGGFFCPCHGSTFDLAGRVYANVPAPTNLTVPPHRYITEFRILIGDDRGA